MPNLTKCIVIDDDIHSRNRISTLLNMIPDTKICLKTKYSDSVFEKINIIAPDLIFLEVELSKKDGFEILRELNSRQISAEIIFITSHTQYSIKAIKFGVFDYLKKPIDIDELKTTIKRFKEQKFNKSDHRKEQILCGLSDREMEVAKLLFEGKTSKEIAIYI